MEKSLKGLRIYLDTHIIDYLYDHRQDYWQDTQELPTISKLAEFDQSDHINELIALQAFLILAYWNNFTLVIGDRLLDELERIPDEKRKSSLLKYAEGIRHYFSVVRHENNEENVDIESNNVYYTTFLSQVLARINKKDHPLYVEAIVRKCNYFLTTDQQVVGLGNQSLLAGLEITSPARFIGSIVQSFPGAFDLSSYEHEFIPEIDFYSWLIPDEDEAK